MTTARGVTYEITAIVRDDLVDAYEKYMRERHIPDVLRSGAFSSASFSRSAPGRYRIRYEASARSQLDDYLANHAAALRGHFTQTFPAGIELSREEWIVIEGWQDSRADDV